MKLLLDADFPGEKNSTEISSCNVVLGKSVDTLPLGTATWLQLNAVVRALLSEMAVSSEFLVKSL